MCEGFSPLTKSKFFHKLKSNLKSCGFAGNYMLHSFQVGAATTATTLGLPEYLLKASSHWSSDAYNHYIKLPAQIFFVASNH